MRLKRILPIAIQRRISSRRHRRRQDQNFRLWLNRVVAHHADYRRDIREWATTGDQNARLRAKKRLRRMEKIITRLLARSNHQRELIEFLKEQHIPGWRRFLPNASPRRR